MVTNRWNLEFAKGDKVRAHHPRGGTISGTVSRIYKMQGYGRRVDFAEGNSVGVDDVCEVIERKSERSPQS
jgi:hypothetical protein